MEKGREASDARQSAILHVNEKEREIETVTHFEPHIQGHLEEWSEPAYHLAAPGDLFLRRIILCSRRASGPWFRFPGVVFEPQVPRRYKSVDMGLPFGHPRVWWCASAGRDAEGDSSQISSDKQRPQAGDI